MQDDKTSSLDKTGVCKIGASYPDQGRPNVSPHQTPSGKIGFVGLGLMGTAMAANLVASCGGQYGLNHGWRAQQRALHARRDCDFA
jgi:hypothetical protein